MQKDKLNLLDHKILELKELKEQVNLILKIQKELNLNKVQSDSKTKKKDDNVESTTEKVLYYSC